MLLDLEHEEGIPNTAGMLFFEDVGILAATYDYLPVKTLQEHLEEGNLIPPESVHRLASFMFTVLRRAHNKGWLHTDLQPKHVLLSLDSPAAEEPRGSAFSSGTTGDSTGSALSSRRESAASSIGRRGPVGLVCGWGRALRLDTADGPAGPLASGGLLQLLDQLPAWVPRSMAPMSPRVALQGRPSWDTLDSFGESDFSESMPTKVVLLDKQRYREPAASSIFSAPEQLVGLFAGIHCELSSTDVYRVAAIILMASGGRGALGEPGNSLERHAGAEVEDLRELCNHRMLQRAEGKAAPPEEQQLAERRFANGLQALLSRVDAFSDCETPELLEWFRGCLARDPPKRFKDVDGALEALDEAWSKLEERMLAEVPLSPGAHAYSVVGNASFTQNRFMMTDRSEDEDPDGSDRSNDDDENEYGGHDTTDGRLSSIGSRRRRLVFTPPPELAEMKVL